MRRTATRLATAAFGVAATLAMTISAPAPSNSSPVPAHADHPDDAWYLHPLPWILLLLAALAVCAVAILIALRRNSAKGTEVNRENESF